MPSAEDRCHRKLRALLEAQLRLRHLRRIGVRCSAIAASFEASHLLQAKTAWLGTKRAELRRRFPVERCRKSARWIAPFSSSQWSSCWLRHLAVATWSCLYLGLPHCLTTRPWQCHSHVHPHPHVFQHQSHPLHHRRPPKHRGWILCFSQRLLTI